MKTGKIIHYNQNEGKGIINADGQPHEFHIQQWRGNAAPQLNNSVLLDFSDAGEIIIHPIANQQGINQQQLSELSGQLGQAFKQHGSNLGSQLVNLHGLPVLAAYCVFLLSGLFLTLINSNGLNISLHSWSESLGRVGISNGLTQLVFWLSVIGIAAPAFIRHKLTPLLLCLPLLTALLVVFDFYSLYSAGKAALEQQAAAISAISSSIGGSFGRGMADQLNTQLAPQVSFGKVIDKAGMGFYGILLAGIFLALQGVTRFLANKQQ